MPDDAYVLSPATAEKLRQLIRDFVPGRKGGNGQSGGARVVAFVEVTGPVDDGWYPCVPTNYLSYSDSWEDYLPARVNGANGETLEDGKRYLALRVPDGEDGVALWKTFCCDDQCTPEPIS